MGSETILEVRGLSKSFGKKEILKDINLTVNGGEVFGFLGPNGSGKTTTIKLMLGLLNYGSGSIRICGHEVKTEFEKAVANIGGIIENPEMYKYLTGRQNLMQYARMQDGITGERMEEVIDIVHLRARIDDKISKYSLGMRQRLGIAQAILHRPRLLVLDEPTNGLDPAGIKELRDIFKRLAHEEGCAVFVSSHMLAELEQMCDRVCVINHGVVVDNMTMEEIRTEKKDDNRQNYHIDTQNKDGAIKAAEEMGIDYTLYDGQLTVMIEKENISKYIRKLVLADVDIEAVIPIQKSLEDAFMEIIGDTPEGGVGQ
ncbi:MAG TPA: bacitracin ABC transporter ATP-binding protein [Ruminococcaceae bacterium]|nr:bacitracin ABC transporter ATP-binding protein [Oscillospiraceae bacterium]